MGLRKNLLSIFSVLSVFSVANFSLAAGPPPAVTIENVRIGFASKAQGGQYKTGCWAPIRVDLKAGALPFQGILDVSAADDAGTAVHTQFFVDLKANEMRAISAFARPASRSDLALSVRSMADRKEKASWSGSLDPPYGPEVTFIISAGSPVGIAEMKDLPKYANALSANGNPSLVVVPATFDPSGNRDSFPSRWFEYDSAEAVVLDTGANGLLEYLAQSNKSEALLGWVAQGGHLVISVGRNWQKLSDSRLADALPAIPSGRVKLNNRAELEAFANSTHPLAGDLQITKFEGWEARGGVPLASTVSTPLVIRGTFGFGRITMLGIDVDEKPFSSWEDKKAFWDKAIDLRGRSGDASVLANQPVGAYVRPGSTDLAGTLHESLEHFPGVRLVPFGWVAFFVFIYILLIGPGDYLFLRKVVKRMEMTWITFPATVVVVSALAYAAAYYFKGTELRINKVDALDIDQTSNRVHIRGTTWITLFSPQNRDYGLSIIPLAPEIEPPSSPLAPANQAKSSNVETIMTWFSAPDQNLGAGGGMALGGFGYGYATPGEVDELQGVRVPIWSTKSFLGRWTASSAVKPLDSDLVTVTGDRISGTVTNNLRRPLRQAVLICGRQVYTIGNLAPGQTVTISPNDTKSLSAYMSGVAAGIAQGSQVNYNNGQPVPQTDEEAAVAGRPDIVRAIMFHDGLGSQASAMPNQQFPGLDLTGQAELRRPILVAEVDGPAVLLHLEGAGSTPKMKQTTILRVILPLKNDPTDPGATKR